MKKHMLDTLAAEQEKRNDNPKWLEAEFTLMLNTVNTERVRRRLSPVTREELRRREQLAVGHVDYSSKFALYCAELALGLPDRGP